MQRLRASSLVSTASSAWLFFLPGIPLTQAQFTLDFTPNDGTYLNNDAHVSCGMSYIASANCGGGWGGDVNLAGAHIDGTAFYQRILQDGAGNRYFQVIVGDYLVDDFALEYIIKTGGSGNWWSGWSGSIPQSSSTGDPADRNFNMKNPYDTATTPSTKSGTGTGNPNRVVMRQLLSDGQSSQEFLKDQFDKKPLIRQITTDGDILTEAEIDMRGKTYADITAIDPTTAFKNKATLLDPAKAGNAGDFDNTNNPTGNPYMTAGGYTYTPGSGTNDFGGSNGTYTYTDAAFGDFFDPNDKEYVQFCDPAQNPNWSGVGPCTNDDGSGGGGGGWGW